MEYGEKGSLSTSLAKKLEWYLTLLTTSIYTHTHAHTHKHTNKHTDSHILTHIHTHPHTKFLSHAAPNSPPTPLSPLPGRLCTGPPCCGGSCALPSFLCGCSHTVTSTPSLPFLFKFTRPPVIINCTAYSTLPSTHHHQLQQCSINHCTHCSVHDVTRCTIALTAAYIMAQHAPLTHSLHHVTPQHTPWHSLQLTSCPSLHHVTPYSLRHVTHCTMSLLTAYIMSRYALKDYCPPATAGPSPEAITIKPSPSPEAIKPSPSPEVIT